MTVGIPQFRQQSESTRPTRFLDSSAVPSRRTGQGSQIIRRIAVGVPVFTGIIWFSSRIYQPKAAVKVTILLFLPQGVDFTRKGVQESAGPPPSAAFLAANAADLRLRWSTLLFFALTGPPSRSSTINPQHSASPQFRHGDLRPIYRVGRRGRRPSRSTPCSSQTPPLDYDHRQITCTTPSTGEFLGENSRQWTPFAASPHHLASHSAHPLSSGSHPLESIGTL